MKKHVIVRLGMLPFILLSMVLMPMSGASGEELAKEQTARLAMGVADIGTAE